MYRYTRNLDTAIKASSVHLGTALQSLRAATAKGLFEAVDEFGGAEGVAEEHGDGHGADAAGVGRDFARDGLHLFGFERAQTGSRQIAGDAPDAGGVAAIGGDGDVDQRIGG